MKTNLFKSLTLAIGMLASVTSVTADEITATLVHTAAQWKFSGDKHKSLQVDTERTFHQRYLLVML